MDKKKAQVVLGVVVLTVLVFVGGIFAGRSFATSMSSDEQNKADKIARAAEEPERPFTDESERVRLNVWNEKEAREKFAKINSSLSVTEVESILSQPFESTKNPNAENEGFIRGPGVDPTGYYTAKYGSKYTEGYGVGYAISIRYSNNKVTEATFVPGLDERIKFYYDAEKAEASKNG